jgi:large subunit ribosomal protein LP1
MASSSELACAYAALILHDDEVAITADKLAALIKAAGMGSFGCFYFFEGFYFIYFFASIRHSHTRSSTEVEAFWPALFAKSVNSDNIASLISAIGSGGSAPAAAAPAAGGKAPAAEAKKAEPEPEEEEAAMDFDLFG